MDELDVLQEIDPMHDAISTALMIVFLALPLISAIRLIVKRMVSVRRWGIWFLVSSLGCYLLMLASVQFTELHLDAKLKSYDLDGNGGYSGAEVTPQMEEAMADWASDTGRTFAPFTGLIVSPIYSGLWHLLIGLPYIAIRRCNKKMGEQAAT